MNMQITPYPLGAHCEGKGIRFSFVSAKEDCGIIIYDRKTETELERIPFDPQHKIGNVYCAFETKYRAADILYQFYEGTSIVEDERAVMLAGVPPYGKAAGNTKFKAGLVTDSFDWQNDKNPKIPYENCIAYLLHVRGFTKHASSRIRAAKRGTFRGVMEKLSYLQEIGITTVELQPAYEFSEVATKEERSRNLPYYVRGEESDSLEISKVNYWGYKKGYYYTPKTAYAAGTPVTEFKELVRELHKYGMELVMQFYFPKEVSIMEIPEILRFWVTEYHVDGFHLMGENLPADLLAADPVLADSKLWYDQFSTDCISERKEEERRSNLAIYQDDYLYTMRRFLKGDEDMVKAVMYHMRHVPNQTGRIHYMSNYYGMTLMDMVSYDRKHNEQNEEENRDGNDYNCSWNCGEEGNTRKKKINSLRLRQVKNAMCMLLLSQSTPLIFMGDEFGNSQKGNNNPYCQDNEITWLDWKDQERHSELYEFWKQLVTIRKCHPVLHQRREPRVMDYLACGYPDLSYHGLNAWRAQTMNYSRCIGMMYCGKYVKINSTLVDDFFYIAMNMHWEKHAFGLPRLPKGMRWQKYICTNEVDAEGELQDENIITEAGVEESLTADIRRVVPARSIVVFKSVL